MNVEIWTDYGCPYCYMAKTRFEQALQVFPHRDEVTVTYRSFELDPELPKFDNPDAARLLAIKDGVTLEAARATLRDLTEQAKTSGIVLQYDRVIPTNTFDAHRLSQWARTLGKSKEFAQALMNGHFAEGRHLSQFADLTDLAESVGLDPLKAQEVLHSGAFAEEVRADELEGDELGIEHLPFFVFDRKFAVSGNHPVETFTKVLNKVHSER
jgi:predicted DsbA family dithiol-disulfide isomerase